MTKQHKVYLAGPMRGYYEFNFPAFHRAAQKLREAGHVVFDPAAADEAHPSQGGFGFVADGLEGTMEELHELQFPLEEAQARDLVWIREHATCIALLRGWHNSTGAKAELKLALELGLDVMVLGLVP